MYCACTRCAYCIRSCSSAATVARCLWRLRWRDQISKGSTGRRGVSFAGCVGVGTGGVIILRHQRTLAGVRRRPFWVPVFRGRPWIGILVAAVRITVGCGAAGSGGILTDGDVYCAGIVGVRDVEAGIRTHLSGVQPVVGGQVNCDRLVGTPALVANEAAQAVAHLFS